MPVYLLLLLSSLTTEICELHYPVELLLIFMWGNRLIQRKLLLIPGHITYGKTTREQLKYVFHPLFIEAKQKKIVLGIIYFSLNRQNNSNRIYLY